jgi:hypothetical protein
MTMVSEDINWMVPLRRAVVKKPIEYRDFLADWLEQLRDTDNAFVLGIWYNDTEGKDFSPADYDRGIVALRRWMKMTFDEGYTIATNPVGITTVQTHVPNFHARLWKGPKRVLLEQAANGDPVELAQIQPFNLIGGRIELQRDAQGKAKPIELLPGDVLEIALHEFLVACGQKRFEDIEFDPVGSFYLGTTVRSKSGHMRLDLPLLHDNMLAMRFQLLTALNMGNCYHDQPVYSDEYVAEISASQLLPQGAGVYARGMPYGGNASATVKAGPDGDSSMYWKISQLNTNQPEVERPVYMPVYNHLLRYIDGQPITWGWTCTPFTLFFFNMMADAHQSAASCFPAHSEGRA